MNYIEQMQPITEKTYNKLTRTGQAFMDLQSWIKCLDDDENEYEVVKESRSLIVLDSKNNPGNGWDTSLQMLKVKCPDCGRWFVDMAFQDPCETFTECPHCKSELQY